MTNRSRALLLLTPYSLLLTALGCAQPQAESAPAPAEQPAVALAPQPASPADAAQLQPGAAKVQPQPEPPPPPPPTFAFPADAGGKAVARVVAPDVSHPLPADRSAAAPKPRAVPAKVLEPEPPSRPVHASSPLPTPRPTAARPAAPPEKVPLNLGAGADGVPGRPVLPVAAVVTERARDVNLPPPAPTLGRPLADRVSLDDPTGELGNAIVVAERVKTPLAQSPFLKVSVPDPFELAEQVRPKVPAAAEPSPAPVAVNPQRVK